MKTKLIKNEKCTTSILGFGWYTKTRDGKDYKHANVFSSKNTKSIEP